MTQEDALLRWDMMRARHNGKIVYRHMPGLLRIVRGRMSLKATHVPVLGRAASRRRSAATRLGLTTRCRCMTRTWSTPMTRA
jgi:hypothetical protein